MKKILFILFTIILLLLSGYSDKEVTYRHYTYLGENKDWIADYKADTLEIFREKDGKLDYDNKEKDQFRITFKKDVSELASVKNVTITCKGDLWKSTLHEEYTETDPLTKKTFTMGGGGSSTNLSIDDYILVTVKLDGKVQTFKMFQMHDGLALLDNSYRYVNNLWDLNYPLAIKYRMSIA